MDAPCEIQGSIHVFRLVNNMCPGKWVHINDVASFISMPIQNHTKLHKVISKFILRVHA